MIIDHIGNNNLLDENIDRLLLEENINLNDKSGQLSRIPSRLRKLSMGFNHDDFNININCDEI